MKAKTLTAEKLQQLKEIRERLTELQQRSEERLALLEGLTSEELYCK